MEIPSKFTKNNIDHFIFRINREENEVKYFTKQVVCRWFTNSEDAKVFEEYGKEVNSSEVLTDTHTHQAFCELFGAGRCTVYEWVKMSKQ